MHVIDVLLAVALASAIILIGVAILFRHLMTNSNQNDIDGQIEAVRQEKLDLEKRLAVEAVKSSRLPELERTLGEKTSLIESLKEAKAAAETALSEKMQIIEQLEERLNLAESSLETAQQGLNQLSSRNAVLQETLEQERKQAEEKLRLLEAAQEGMTKEFQRLADATMQTHGETFSRQNKEQMNDLLNPLKEKLKEFQEGLQQANRDSIKERATLIAQVRTLSEASVKMTLETTNLTKALKADPGTQGAWGQETLETILERAGLRKGEEYTVQQSHTTDEGKRLRSDVLVHIPGGEKIVIDSKVSLTAFHDYVNAEDDEERSTHLDRHLISMRSHIRGLCNKEYHSAAGSGLDYVIMFVPIEPALGAALQGDPKLTIYAVESNVCVATPNTLMTTLRTVANLWRIERWSRNADAMAVRAGKIYDKFVGFVEDMEGIGQRLTQAQNSYQGAMNKLSLGRGNLINQVEQLKELGAKTSKSLPDNLIGEPEIEALPALSITEAVA